MISINVTEAGPIYLWCDQHGSVLDNPNLYLRHLVATAVAHVRQHHPRPLCQHDCSHPEHQPGPLRLRTEPAERPWSASAGSILEANERRHVVTEFVAASRDAANALDAAARETADFSRAGGPTDTPLCLSLPPADPDRSSRARHDE